MGHFDFDLPPLNGSFWSLWVEIGFYAVLPLLFLMLRGRTTKTTGWIMQTPRTAGAADSGIHGFGIGA